MTASLNDYPKAVVADMRGVTSVIGGTEPTSNALTLYADLDEDVPQWGIVYLLTTEQLRDLLTGRGIE